MQLHFKVESSIHIHGNGLNCCASFRPKPFEEHPYRLAAAPLPNPEHAPSIGIQHHGRVAMSLKERELVHYQSDRFNLGQTGQLIFQALAVDLAYGFPMKAG